MSGSQVIGAGAALSAFSGDSQHNRFLRLEFPFQDGPQTATLLVNTLRAHEELSRDFRIDAEVLSDDARIPLKMMMARMVTISLVREDGSLRYFNGYVTEFRFVRTDGGFAFYHMVLEPWLAFARLRKDNVSFHGKSVREITEATLQHYRQADWQMNTFDDDPRLTVANQHNESDYNHLHRRWEARGLHYWYEHRFDGHKLVLSDRSVLAEPIDATRHDDPDVIPFRDKSGALEDDGIREWTAVRRLGSGKTTLASFDYKNPVAQRASVGSANQQGDVFPHEVYENAGAYGFRTRSDGEKLAQQRMVEQDKDTQYFEAAGNDRTVQPGRTFKLGGHFSAEPRSVEYDPEPRHSIAGRDYLILALDHEASNNYLAGRGAASHYENRFTCIRKDIHWRPGPNYNSEPCANPGVQTAIVVGPAGEEIHTDGLGRVKVQFHWDRLGNYDENSSPWIRVMVPAAGSQFGQVRLPRVGEEVAVVYPDGNIDHPLILGALYNARHMPPWELPGQAALSGLRSRELGGGGARGNHLILDDTSQKIQAQLKSDHQCSQLSLGHITRIEDTSGRKDSRGEGWELATNAWGVARAGQGMLITTEARPNATSHLKDMSETVQRLASAAEIQEQLGSMAERSGAQEAGQQSEAAEDVKAQTDAIRGGAKGAFPELGEPHLVVASPAGIELTTAQSTHIASARHTAITSGKSLSIASIDGLFASVGKTFRLFVHKAGMKLVAAAGKVTVEARSDNVEVIANKVLELLSESDWVNIRGKKGVRLHGVNNMLEIGEKVQFFTAAPVLFHGNLETLPAKSVSQAFNERSSNYHFDQEVNFIHVDNKPARNIAYELVRDDGAVIDGKTAASGSTGLQKAGGLESYTIRYKGELP
ncbi:type VI secretion system tip protein VgrG [Massilia agilis]|uniref:Type VI secretion system tip protein VgrG n=1 Tax=Massilia agilis TaxID=1811226 RepID=A0ABT2DBG9_9BURK|nr:type VI secretion system Vgr family protein [Massilia agilis]MCS0808559.1 type VI secretion system tip protein VgrG [Massilia agilis]